MPVLDLVRATKKYKRCRSTTKHSETLKCLFCGGDKCKHCGPNAYLSLTDSPAVDKLHSSWISDHIIAMQRPFHALFKDSFIINQFRRYRITSIFNLTEIGEHPYCGCGNLEYSGFSYDPNLFMVAGINYFNYAWRDMTVPTMNMMMDLVHVAMNEIWRGGRIAVHCHAGYGRTGTAIACILIALDDLSAKEAIELVRQRRPGSVQTSYQADFVRYFEICYKRTLHVYPYTTDDIQQSIQHKTYKESLSDQFYSLSFSELMIPELRKVGKILYNTISCFRDMISYHHIRGSGMICSAITGLIYDHNHHDMISLHHTGYRYDVSHRLIPTAFYSSIISQININQWDTYFALMVMTHGDTNCADILGLIPLSSSSSISYCASFMISQLLLSWLDTRADALFDAACINACRSIWQVSESGMIELMDISELKTLNNTNLSSILNSDDIYKDKLNMMPKGSYTCNNNMNDDKTDIISTDMSYTSSSASYFQRRTSVTQPILHDDMVEDITDSHDDQCYTIISGDLPIHVPTCASSSRRPKNTLSLSSSSSSSSSSMTSLLIQVMMNTNKVKLANIQAIIQLTRILQEDHYHSGHHKADANVSAEHDSIILPCDAAVLRIAISCIKASSNESLLHLSSLSIDMIQYAATINSEVDYDVSSITQSSKDNRKIRSDVLIMWKTLTHLARSSWLVTDHDTFPSSSSSIDCTQKTSHHITCSKDVESHDIVEQFLDMNLNK